MLVTNTQFTEKAIAYGICQQMNMLGWNFPVTNNLAMRIEQLKMIPITALTTLTQQQKRYLLAKNCVLCQDLHKFESILRNIQVNQQKIAQVLQEAAEVCKPIEANS